MSAYDKNDLRRAVAAAIRAPSLHNSQPWLFRLRGGALEVVVDPSRVVPTGDPTGWAARIACGGAVYNARLALGAGGTPPVTQLRPDTREPHLVARLRPGTPRPPTYEE